MPVVAYFANLFPSPVEPYVVEEIRELRKRGITVVPGSARRAGTLFDSDWQPLADEAVYLQPLQLRTLLRAAWLGLSKFSALQDLFRRVLLQGRESPWRRLYALLHTWLGIYYALLLQKHRICHIHVHHGYFGSWIAMVAARMLNISFSMTLHGSDLLLSAAYLDVKLKHCQYCLTISDFNRRHLLANYPDVDPNKIAVHRMGVDCRASSLVSPRSTPAGSPLAMLAVGRLHPVKDHAFLIRACQMLKQRGLRFRCRIAGEGDTRPALESLIRDSGLSDEVILLGQLPRTQLEEYYEAASLVVLTSRSEGIPLVLMEAMVCGKPVLAPAITGIPELVSNGRTGFLYHPGSLEEFAAQVEFIANAQSLLGPLCHAARQHVLEHFDREKNLRAFCDLFVTHLGDACPDSAINRHTRVISYENPVLQ